MIAHGFEGERLQYLELEAGKATLERTAPDRFEILLEDEEGHSVRLVLSALGEIRAEVEES